MENVSVTPIKLNGLRVEVREASNKEAQIISLEKALKIFKKKLEKDGVLFEIRERQYYTKPSVIARTAYKKLHPKKKRVQAK